MSLKRNVTVVYEPIDSRTLSKKEKFHYLVTLMRKPRLSSDSILTPGNFTTSSSTSPADPTITPGGSSTSSSSECPFYSDSDFDSDYNSDYTSASDAEADSDDEETNGNTFRPARVRAPTPQECLQEELRQLDTFWSFKSIPRAALLTRSNYKPRATLPAGTDPEVSSVHCGDTAGRDIPPEVDPPCTSPSPSPSNMPTSDAGASTPSPSDVIIWSPKEEIVADTNTLQGQREDIPVSASAPAPSSTSTFANCYRTMGKQNQQQQLVGYAVLEPRDEIVQMSYHYLSPIPPSTASPGSLAPDVQTEIGDCAAPIFRKPAKQLACEKYLLPREARYFSFNQASWRTEREREREEAIVVTSL